MSKENNLTDFLTDVADAIREKKGTTEKINPQDFSDEIKGIKTSSSIWTGHVDVEGLKAIGWNDEDIAYFQEHGVNWMEEDDEYYKVSDDNKALYGVLSWTNLSQYKNRIVYLPKIDINAETDWENQFMNCNNMFAIPMLSNGNNPKNIINAFKNCTCLLYVPPLDFSNVNKAVSYLEMSRTLRYTPAFNFIKVTDLSYCFSDCTKLCHIDITTSSLLSASSYLFYNCRSLELVTGDLDVSNIVDFRYFIYGCMGLHSIIPVLDLGKATNVAGFANNCISLRDLKIKNLPISISFGASLFLSKESVLYMIEHESATAAITITLHNSVYSRLSTDPDIVEALSNHPLVTLASV